MKYRRSLGWNSANKVMVSNFDFVDGSPPWIGSSCRTGIKCAEIRCACCRILHSNTQYVPRGLDGVIVFESLFNLCFVPCLSMRFQIQSVVLVTAGFCCLIHYRSETIRISLVLYSVDNAVGHRYLSFPRFSSRLTKDNSTDSLNIIFRAITKI